MRRRIFSGWVCAAALYVCAIGALSVAAINGDSIQVYATLLIASAPASFLLLPGIYIAAGLADTGMDGSPASTAVAALGFMAAAALNVAALRTCYLAACRGRRRPKVTAA